MMKQIKGTLWKKSLPIAANLLRLLISGGVSLALIAGCSSSDDDADDSSPSAYGFVSVDVDEEDGMVETELVASFIRFDDLKLAAQAESYVGSVTDALDGSERCFVGDSAELLLIEDTPELLVNDPEIGEFISAGETLTFTSSAGTYATLEGQTQTSPIDGSALIFYERPSGALAGEPPAGLTLDIEGDVFRMFSNVAVPELPAPLNDFSPTIGGPVNENTSFAFSWTPSGVDGAMISLGISSDTESIDCLLVDDGSFSLLDLGTPQSGLLDNFNGTVRDVDRGAVTVEQAGNDTLLIFAEDGRGG